MVVNTDLTVQYTNIICQNYLILKSRITQINFLKMFVAILNLAKPQIDIWKKIVPNKDKRKNQIQKKI